MMGNHFHVLLETPEANLVTGMKLLLGTFSQGWNRRRLRRGHVFQGRYKSIPVNASDSDPYYLKIVADYIHLNPARAGLAGGNLEGLDGSVEGGAVFDGFGVVGIGWGGGSELCLVAA